VNINQLLKLAQGIHNLLIYVQDFLGKTERKLSSFIGAGLTYVKISLSLH
jgi:hypothetical protein